MIVLILVFRLVVGVRIIDVLGPEKRRRRSVQEKTAIVQQSFEPGMTVSLGARQHGVAASQLFLWRKQYQEGSLTAVAAGEQVVPASELASAMKQIKELQHLLGKKTMENELLKEAVEYGRQKVDSARALVAGGWRISLVSRCLRVSRAQLHAKARRSKDWQDRRCKRKPDDTETLVRIHTVIGALPTYGYRRVWARLRRQSETDDIKGLGDLKKGTPKTPMQGGGGRRKRWIGDKGRKIYEWDSQHGELEGYRASDGEHLGAFDPKTGKQIKGPDPKGQNIKKYL
ncbi:transposase [Klebsiella pneumoniae]|nr:transposase [Klebsiella pneumoniae]